MAAPSAFVSSFARHRRLCPTPSEPRVTRFQNVITPARPQGQTRVAIARVQPTNKRAALAPATPFGVGMAHGMRPAAAAFVTVVVVASAASSFVAFSRDRSATVAFWILAGGPTVLLAAVAAVWAKSEEYLWEWLAPKWGDFSRGLLGAAGLFGLAWAFARAVTPVGSPREIWLVSLYSQIGDPRVLQLHAPAVGAAIAVVALAEELLWRGTVTQLIAERMGSRSAWVWSAALYALVY